MKQLQAYIWLRLAYIRAKSAIRTLLQDVRHRIFTGQSGSNIWSANASAQRGMNDDTRAALDAARLRTAAMHEWMIAGYTPRPSRAPLTLLWSSGEGAAPTSLWKNVAHVVETHIIPGTHVTCLSEHLDVLIAHLASCLNRAQGDHLKAEAYDGEGA